MIISDMKKYIILIIAAFFTMQANAAENNENKKKETEYEGTGKILPDTATENNFTLESSIIVENVSNISGGLKRGSSLLALFDLSMDYKPFSKGLLKNSGIYLRFLKTTGNGPSERYIGDAQVVSNIDGKNNSFVYELLLKQKIGRFNLLAGLHDLNSEFMMSDYAGDFINSSFGISPAVSLNIPVSIFPATTFGGILSYNTNNFDIAGGFYNLNYRFCDAENFSFNDHFFSDGYLALTEFRQRYSISEKHPGEIKVGGYYKECSPGNEEDVPEECVSENNYGIYFVGDQVLHQFSSGSSIGAFVQLGFTPADINYASEYYGAGISIRDLPENALVEQFGIAFGKVNLNRLYNNRYIDTENHETVVEFTALIPLFSKFKIQPDVQYVINPSGSYDNAVTGLVRLIIDLK